MPLYGLDSADRFEWAKWLEWGFAVVLVLRFKTGSFTPNVQMQSNMATQDRVFLIRSY